MRPDIYSNVYELPLSHARFEKFRHHLLSGSNTQDFV